MGFTNFPNGITSFGTPILGMANGIGLGEIFWLVTEKASTNLFYESLRKRVDDSYIFTTLAAAYAACTSGQGDTIYATPGLYTQTATLDWTKDDTHLVGCTSPVAYGRYSKPKLLFYTDTAAVDYVLHLTGDECQFHSVAFQNGNTGGSATTTNLAAVGLAGYQNYFNNVRMSGINTTNQIATAGCSSLEILNGAGECLFDYCVIGQNYYGGTRTSTTQGHMLCSSSSTVPSPQNMEWRNCRFLSRSETAAAVPMVYVSSTYGGDRMWLFDRCVFHNFSSNWLTKCAAVFDKGDTVTPQSWNIILKQCTANGYTYWCNDNILGAGGQSWVEADMPITGTGGGLTLAPAGTAGN